MRFEDFLRKESCSVVSTPQTSDALLKRMVASLVDSPQVPAALDAVYRREALGSTVIQDGLFIPHAKVGAIEDVCAAIAICPDGMSYSCGESLFKKPVKIVVLILSPMHKPGEYLRVLETVCRRFRDPDLLERIVAEQDSEVIFDLLNEDAFAVLS